MKASPNSAAKALRLHMGSASLLMCDERGASGVWIADPADIAIARANLEVHVFYFWWFPSFAKQHENCALRALSAECLFRCQHKVVARADGEGAVLE